MAAYMIDVRPRARRSLRQLDPSAQKAIAQAIDGLATDPRPPDFLPLTGHRPYLRVRSGDYRVIYTAGDAIPPVEAIDIPPVQARTSRFPRSTRTGSKPNAHRRRLAGICPAACGQRVIWQVTWPRWQRFRHLRGRQQERVR